MYSHLTPERPRPDGDRLLGGHSAGSVQARPAYCAASPKTTAHHAFAPIVEAQPDPFIAPHAATPMALDPGTDLAEWPRLDFFDREEPLGVTTRVILSDPATVRRVPSTASIRCVVGCSTS